MTTTPVRRSRSSRTGTGCCGSSPGAAVRGGDPASVEKFGHVVLVDVLAVDKERVLAQPLDGEPRLEIEAHRAQVVRHHGQLEAVELLLPGPLLQGREESLPD